MAAYYAIQDFLGVYGSHIAIMLIGVIMGLIAYAIRHPEDFFVRVEEFEDDTPDQVVLIEEVDHEMGRHVI